MDFDYAATKLKKDHDALRSRARNRPQTLASKKKTLEAKKREEYRQKQLEKKREKERYEKLKLDYVHRGFDKCESRLGVVRGLGAKMDMSSSDNNNDNDNMISDGNNVLILEATSIHGQGDKITLPTSLLSTLASRDLLQTSQERGQPLFFRLGIKRSGYMFPSSLKMKELMNSFNLPVDVIQNGGDNDISNNSNNSKNDGDDCIMEDVVDQDDEDDKEEKEEAKWEQAYLDELSHQYISYVYATVIEFTQDEGFLGLPASIAAALLQKSASPMKSKFTVDPASVSVPAPVSDEDKDNDTSMDDDGNGKIDKSNITNNLNSNKRQEEEEENLETKTPGHPAYGLFPVPTNPIEITLLTHLPLGKKCTLQPTKDAIVNGFYNLKDVKLALEQSLVRTRGCLNEGDVVHCWHRGKKFDLNVKDVTPSRVGAVSCVNTDVEVDIAAADDIDDNENNINNDSKSPSNGNTNQKIKGGRTISGGYKLSDERNNGSTSASASANSFQKLKGKDIAQSSLSLSPEPPIGQKENVITIQIRVEGGKQFRRRFDSSISSMKDIFSFVINQQQQQQQQQQQKQQLNDVVVDANCMFRLVTRFPRKVFNLNDTKDILLKDMGFSKQEMFLIEKI